jgi:hypothetical protein
MGVARVWLLGRVIAGLEDRVSVCVTLLRGSAYIWGADDAAGCAASASAPPALELLQLQQQMASHVGIYVVIPGAL